MKQDVEIPEVKNVTIAIVREKNILNQDQWAVHLINNNSFSLENTLVTSTGYGEREGEAQRSSTLRHFLETVPANSSALIEPIDSQVFHLTNEYWVSYYTGSQIYDRKFVFVPETICEENLIFIREL
ncbi:MAG: hypothetical protein KBF45_16330, partial [Cyclobacteriaceae bacterium]|nr:hypothetical protein [Cyclobacteriaceae bacterium]